MTLGYGAVEEIRAETEIGMLGEWELEIGNWSLHVVDVWQDYSFGTSRNIKKGMTAREYGTIHIPDN